MPGQRVLILFVWTVVCAQGKYQDFMGICASVCKSPWESGAKNRNMVEMFFWLIFLGSRNVPWLQWGRQIAASKIRKWRVFPKKRSVHTVDIYVPLWLHLPSLNTSDVGKSKGCWGCCGQPWEDPHFVLLRLYLSQRCEQECSVISSSQQWGEWGRGGKSYVAVVVFFANHAGTKTAQDLCELPSAL